MVEGLPSPAWCVVICVQVALSTTCESENGFMMSVVLYSWHPIAWGIMESKGDGPVDVKENEVIYDSNVCLR